MEAVYIWLSQSELLIPRVHAFVQVLSARYVLLQQGHRVFAVCGCIHWHCCYQNSPAFSCAVKSGILFFFYFFFFEKAKMNCM